MADEVKSVLGGWVAKFQWDEVVMGTTWQSRPRGLRSMWRNGYMANQQARDIGIRLVRPSGGQDAG
jgi:formylglycine-generating enzyme required for sulfatase activity